jgi:hypothetical protein
MQTPAAPNAIQEPCQTTKAAVGTPPSARAVGSWSTPPERAVLAQVLHEWMPRLLERGWAVGARFGSGEAWASVLHRVGSAATAGARYSEAARAQPPDFDRILKLRRHALFEINSLAALILQCLDGSFSEEAVLDEAERRAAHFEAVDTGILCATDELARLLCARINLGGQERDALQRATDNTTTASLAVLVALAASLR